MGPTLSLNDIEGRYGSVKRRALITKGQLLKRPLQKIGPLKRERCFPLSFKISALSTLRAAETIRKEVPPVFAAKDRSPRFLYHKECAGFKAGPHSPACNRSTWKYGGRYVQESNFVGLKRSE